MMKIAPIREVTLLDTKRSNTILGVAASMFTVIWTSDELWISNVVVSGGWSKDEQHFVQRKYLGVVKILRFQVESSLGNVFG